MLPRSSSPWAWNPARRSATWSSTWNATGLAWLMALFGLALGVSRFVKFTVRQSPAATRSTSGRGRLSARIANRAGVVAVAGAVCTTSRASA